MFIKFFITCIRLSQSLLTFQGSNFLSGHSVIRHGTARPRYSSEVSIPINRQCRNYCVRVGVFTARVLEVANRSSERVCVWRVYVYSGEMNGAHGDSSDITSSLQSSASLLRSRDRSWLRVLDVRTMTFGGSRTLIKQYTGLSCLCLAPRRSQTIPAVNHSDNSSHGHSIHSTRTVTVTPRRMQCQLFQLRPVRRT